MKYAVIAALLATTTSAATGCKDGIKTEIFSDENCKKETTSTHTYTSAQIAKTGECNVEKASEDDVKALKH